MIELQPGCVDKDGTHQMYWDVKWMFSVACETWPKVAVSTIKKMMVSTYTPNEHLLKWHDAVELGGCQLK
jgi:hypothetical protein